MLKMIYSIYPKLVKYFCQDCTRVILIFCQYVKCLTPFFLLNIENGYHENLISTQFLVFFPYKYKN